MTVAHQLFPDARRDFRQADFDLGQKLDVSDQQEVYERCVITAFSLVPRKVLTCRFCFPTKMRLKVFLKQYFILREKAV